MSTEEQPTSISITDDDKPSHISKNQQRKQKRRASMLEKRKSKRKEEKAKLKQRRLEKLKNSDEQSLTRPGPKYTRMENSSCRIRICIDCRYDSMMSDKDVGSLQKQISFLIHLIVVHQHHVNFI